MLGLTVTVNWAVAVTLLSELASGLYSTRTTDWGPLRVPAWTPSTVSRNLPAFSGSSATDHLAVPVPWIWSLQVSSSLAGSTRVPLASVK